jgi:AraC-like DNA-binding protein
VKEAVGPTENLTCVRLNDSYVLGSLLAAYLRSLTGQLDGISEEASYSLSQIALDLVIAVLAEPPIYNEHPNKGNVLYRAQAYIQAHSRNPSFSPPAVAAALKISERYVQKIFKEAGWTTRGYLLHCRLKNAEADLLNPSLSRLSITDIAIRAGFTEPTHFSRRFREAYGESAREYRRRAKERLRRDKEGR